MSTRRWSLFLGLLLLLPKGVLAKRTKGTFKLSGAQTEVVLSNFAVSPEGGRATFRIGCDEMYENEKPLMLHVYKDDVWAKFQKTPLCADKIKLAHHTSDLAFAFKGDGPLAPAGGKWQAVTTILLGEPSEDQLPRSTFFYFVVDDCSLERYFHDNKIPPLTFVVDSWNYRTDRNNKIRTTQLGAEESWLFDLHTITAFLSAVIFAWLFFNMTARFARKKNNNTVHAAVLWIAAAAALDCASSIFSLFHLEIYHYNGVGIYTCDAVAAHLESLCDASIILFLLSLGAGWTLPSDVVGINPGANSIRGIFADMARPLGAVMKFNIVGILAVSIVGLHVILAQWGRMYDDDFESYHDFGHLPGRILMGLRFVLGFVFLGTTLQTRLNCRVQQLQSFYGVMAVTGFFWFQMLPALTFICNWMLPYYIQHPAVYVGSAILQSTSLVLLAWLVTSHATAYHQYSHMSSNEKGPNLTESLSGSSLHGSLHGSQHSAREWKLLGNAKVRLD
jgi:hypothetical protein